jgi:hypothetical protein
LLVLRITSKLTKGTQMHCQTRDEIEEHLSDIRVIAARVVLTTEEKEAAFRAERFAIALLQEHDAAGHNGKRCPLATQL